MSVAHTFLFAVGSSMTTWGKLSELPGVARDIDKVFDALVDGGPGFGLADRSRSVKLLDKGAREVKERWEEFIEAIEIDALVVFFFAGHGALVGEHDLRLLLADSERSRKDESTLSVLQVIRMLENKGVAEWAVILDCCESGEATRDMAIQGARNRTNGGSLIVCATRSGSAWETSEHGGRFTSHLTYAIRTGSCMPPGAEFVDILHAATWAKDQLPGPRPLVDHWGSGDMRVARILPTMVGIGHLQLSEVPSRRDAVKVDPSSIARFVEALREHTEDVLEWNATLPSGARIPQPEFERLLERLEDPEAHVTALLGEGGSGKSALMATLGKELEQRQIRVLGIRLDRLPKAVDTLEKFQQYLDLSIPLPDAAARFATLGRVVVILDQLDALCEFMTERSARLAVITRTIQALANIENVHTIVVCRPFEYQHDIRLHRVNPEAVVLELPPWERVEPHVVAAGVEPAILSEELKDELRRPQVLHTFLRLLADGFEASQLTTYHAMRRLLWNNHVGLPNYERRKEALYGLARWMANHEEQARPLVQMDRYAIELSLLESAGWISVEKQSRVRFRHQSLFDFVLARSVIESGSSLMQVMLEAQGLWIRRRVWSVLAYLRDDNKKHYRREFEDLWEAPSLRRHLKYLLLDFLGQVKETEAFELRLMQQALGDATFKVSAWKAAGRGSAWFNHLCDHELTHQMQDAEAYHRAYPLLIRALDVRPDRVLPLLQAHWTTDRKKAALAARVLESVKAKIDGLASLAENIAAQLGFSSDPMWMESLILALQQIDPDVAYATLSRAFETSVQVWYSLHPDYFREQVEGMRAARPDVFGGNTVASEREVARFRREQLCRIIESDTHFSQLDATLTECEGDAAIFLRHVMPPLREALEHIAISEFERWTYAYSINWPDSSHRSHHTLISAVSTAVEALAEQDADAFADFLQRHETSESATVHHVLLIGLAIAAKRRPELVSQYLKSDPRRLVIGTIQRLASGTITLLKTVARFLSGEDQESLATLIRDWRPAAKAVTPDRRRAELMSARRHRLALLQCLDRAQLSKVTRADIEQLERAFPGETTDTIIKPRFTGARAIESSMSSKQMEKASDDAILGFFGELPDSTNWDHPRRFMAGGSVEASRELANLAKADPQRGLTLARRFDPSTHERPVGMILEAVAEAGVDADQLLACFREAEVRGFRSPEYREHACRALSLLAERDGEYGLPNDICATLNSWLEEGPYDRDASSVADLKLRPDQAIIYNSFGHTHLPNGSYPILSCLFAGLLRRKPPDFDAWLTTLAAHLERNDSPRTWKTLAHKLLGWVVRANKEKATNFLLRLFEVYPELRDDATGLRLIDQLQNFLPHETVLKWIESLRSAGDEWHAQAFGEFLVLRAWHLEDDPWTRDQLEAVFTLSPPFDPHTAAIRSGVALMTAELIRSEIKDESLVPRLIRLAPAQEPSVSAALGQAVSVMMNQGHSPQGEDLLRCLVLYPAHLVQHHTSNLIEMMTVYLGHQTALVADLCEQILTVTKGRISDYKELLNLIVTIQDEPGFLDRGLDLFEQACDLEVLGIDDLLNEHNELLRTPPRSIRRRQKRKKNA